MNASATPVTPSRSPGPLARKPSAAPPAPPRHSGTDQAALAELRNACATYDFLRRKGDPAQFWEMLRLARSRRAIVAPPEGEAPAPVPNVEAGIVHELDALRRNYAPLVRNLRRYLKTVPGLPEPLDRLEMALAFLLASTREHQGIARWLAEPGKHEAKAGEKLRSLATITDPYREALNPWTLEVSAADLDAPGSPGAAVSSPPRPALPRPSGTPAAPVDAKSLELVRRAVQCREALVGVRLEAELWETLLLVTMEPKAIQAALDPDGGLTQRAKADGDALERLYEGVLELRQMYGEWVQSIRASLKEKGLAAEDLKTFEVALGLLLTIPEAQDRLGSWLEDPETGQEEVFGLLAPWMRRAQDCLAALKASRV